MTAVVFETPGLIDVRAFTIMGAHAKPNSANPIGYFGTGLKYAIAVLVRLGATPVVWIGKDRFSFHKKASIFRGSPLEMIVMRVRKDGGKRDTTYELPYTTEYGKNWKIWQAFRELESNTRDERGRTFIADEPIISIGASESTRIIVDLPAFLEAAEKIDEIFLPRAKREGTLLEAIDTGLESPLVYYRTMRAYEAGKPTIYTYNILERMTLTEDRTFAYGFQVKEVIARWVLTEATEKQVEAIITADEDCYEHGLEFPGAVAPSEAFRAVALRRPKGMSRYAHSYWGSYSGGAPVLRARDFSLYGQCPRPWRVVDDQVWDAQDVPVFERPGDMDSDEWDQIAVAIVAKLAIEPKAPVPITIEATAVAIAPPTETAQPEEIPF